MTTKQKSALSHSKESGFTMIELLIVVVIVSVVSFAAVLSIRTAIPNDSDLVHAKKLEQIIARMRTQSILSIQTFGMTITAQGIKYWKWDQEKNWQDASDYANLIHAENLTEGASFEIFRNGETLAIEFEPEANQSDLDSENLLKTKAETVVHVASYADGSISPFEILIYPEGENINYKIEGNRQGDLSIIEPQ